MVAYKCVLLAFAAILCTVAEAASPRALDVPRGNFISCFGTVTLTGLVCKILSFDLVCKLTLLAMPALPCHE